MRYAKALCLAGGMNNKAFLTQNVFAYTIYITTLKKKTSVEIIKNSQTVQAQAHEAINHSQCHLFLRNFKTIFLMHGYSTLSQTG